MKVGDVVTIVRRGPSGGIATQYQLTIARETKTRWLFAGTSDYADKRTLIVKPRYLDYTTRIEVAP